ncbi:MAG: hypothetical protein IAF38_03615, partial [Bacteroidia bacterium]|nr:hypothetical protein [Bacteroidia bacterium]
MNKNICFILLLLVVSGMKSQVDVINLSLDTNLSYLYFEADNVLKVKGVKTSDKIVLTSTAGIISSQGSNKFFLIPDVFKKDTIKVFKNGKEIFSKSFLMIQPPAYRIMVGSSTEMKQTVDEILASPELFPCVPKGNYMEFAKESISGYKMQIKHKNKTKSAVLEHKFNGKMGDPEKNL